MHKYKNKIQNEKNNKVKKEIIIKKTTTQLNNIKTTLQWRRIEIFKQGLGLIVKYEVFIESN